MTIYKIDLPNQNDKLSISGSEILLEEAQRQLESIATSTYKHTTQVDEEVGIYNYDCSGFINYALANSLPKLFDYLQECTKVRPKASDFEEFFSSIDCSNSAKWDQVLHAIDLVPGDIIAWLTPEDSKSTNTGHVLLVKEKPTLNSSNEVVIDIIDSTSRPHGNTDSRAENETNGLGTGTIVLVTDIDGIPIAYRWSTSNSSLIHMTNITMAHLK